jgi:hypothetical protein
MGLPKHPKHGMYYEFRKLAAAKGAEAWIEPVPVFGLSGGQLANVRDNMPADVDEAEAALGRGDILYSERKIDEVLASVRRFYYEATINSVGISPTSSRPTTTRRLKPLKGCTPYELIYEACATQPKHFPKNQLRQIPGLNS